MSHRVGEVIGPRDSETNHRVARIRKRLRDGKRVDPHQLHELEREIRRLRPALVIDHQQVPGLEENLEAIFPTWRAFTDQARRTLAAVTRLDRGPGGRKSALATGFLVAERILLTNQHVAAALGYGTGIVPPGEILARFGAERSRRQAAPTATVTHILREHPTLDLALLELDRSDVPPIEFDTEPVHRRDRVAAIGYPSDDKQAPEYARTLFAGLFGVERVAPGEVIERSDHGFLHDCTTLAGNSGSPLVSLKNGRVVGVHAEGYYLAHNQAVGASQAAAFVRDNIQS